MNTAIINKKSLISLAGFAITLLLCFATMHIMQFFNLTYWIGVTAGAAIFIFMLVMFIILRKNITLSLSIPTIIINAAASGITLSSMYEYLGAYPAVWQSCAVFVALVAMFGLYCLLTNLTFFQNHYIICEIALVVLVAASIILGMIFSDLTAFRLAAISLIPFIATLISLTLRSYDVKEHIKNIACCSFAVLALVIFVVLAVITQGDGLDGFADLGVAGANGKKKKELLNVYDYLPKNK